MSNPAKHRRKKPGFKDEPIDVAELANMSNVAGMLSFLDRKPHEYAKLFENKEDLKPPDTLATELPDTVVDAPIETVTDALSETVAARPSAAALDVASDTVTADSSMIVVPESRATVAAASRDTVPAFPGTTVSVGLAVTLPATVAKSLWYTERTHGIFPASRVRRIVLAQDALTHAEESVYDVLWGPKNQTKESQRTASFGYDTIAKAARVTKMNAKWIVERLIDKGFVKIEALPDPLRRIPTRYCVFSYRAALDNMARSNRFHVIRTGNGVLFAHPLNSIDTVSPESAATATSISSDTVSTEPEATLSVDPPVIVSRGESDTVSPGIRPTVSPGDTLLDTEFKTVTTSPVVAAAILGVFGFVDDDALSTLVRKCRENAPDATDEEIAELGSMTARRISRMKGIANPVGLLIAQTARCFVGEPFEIYRREKAVRERMFADLNEDGTR